MNMRLLLSLLSSTTLVVQGFGVFKPQLRGSVLLMRWNGFTRRTAASASAKAFLFGVKTAVAVTTEEDLELTRRILMREASKSDDTKPTSSNVAESPTTRMTSSLDADAARNAPSSSFSPSSISRRPKNDLMIRAAFGEPTNRTPVWLFRQAGRHLPEYQQYKKQQGKSFLELLDDPESVAECTMQPIRRYDLDAAILFSDILVIAQALNIEVTMPGGVGIQVPNPITSPSDMLARLPSIETAGTKEYVEAKLGHVLEAVRRIRAALDKEAKSIPLIGFSAAPWTLFYYMLGGSSKKNTDIGLTWLKENPTASQQLLDLLTAVVIEYMSAQVDNGVHLLQVFEAMGMMIDDKNFEEFALPCLQKIASAIKARHGDVPLMVFCRGICHLNDRLVGLGYDVITIDGSVDRSTARTAFGSDITLQGNYDPAELIEANGKTVESVRATAKVMLQELGPLRLIANLGEGLGGNESPALVEAFVNAIHEESEELIRTAATR